MRVLLVVHGYPPAAMAGTELYTQALARALTAAGDTVRVIAREADPALPERNIRIEQRDDHEVVLINNTFADSRGFLDVWKAPRIAEALEPLIDEFAPEVAHLQHLTCLSTDLVAALDARGVPIVFTLQDFWLLCQRGQLLDDGLRRCDGPAPVKCARCLGPASWAPPGRSLPLPLRTLAARALPADLAGAGAAALEQRLREVRALCDRVDRFLCPSETMRERFGAFGVDPAKLVRVQAGIDHAPFRGLQRTQGSELRIGFVGTLMASKAPHLLLQAFSRLPPGRASLHVYGSIAAYHGDDSYRQLVEPLLAQPGVQRHGAVPHDQLPCALASLDVIVVPSVWLENAPFVVLEAALAGVPVVASDLGGMRESVRHGESGLLFPPGDAGALAAALQRLIDEPDLLPRLRSGLRTPLSIEADAAQLRPIYRELIEVRRPQQAKLAAVVLNYRTLASAVACVESLQRGSLAPGALLVVDNDSGDGSTSFLRARLGPARVLSSERNRGFAGGVNAGIERALRQGAERVLVVNGDLRVEARTVARLAQALDADPSLGIVGPVLVSAAAPDRVDTDGISFDARTGRMLHRGFGTAWLPRAGVRQVDAVSGACMLITRRMLEQVGLFAEEYFFTFEDLDLCLRARAAGFGVACVDDAIAFHEGGASLATRASRRSYFAVRNHLMLAREHAPGGPFSRAARAAAIVALNAAHVALRGERPRTAGLLAMARGVTDYLRGRSGPD